MVTRGGAGMVGHGSRQLVSAKNRRVRLVTRTPDTTLIYSFSHETGGKNEGDDGVVTVESQLTASAQRNATALYGIADNHKWCDE